MLGQRYFRESLFRECKYILDESEKSWEDANKNLISKISFSLFSICSTTVGGSRHFKIVIIITLLRPERTKIILI